MLRWKCWNSIGFKQYRLLHTSLLTTSLPERGSSRSCCVRTRLTRYHTLQLRLTYKQTSVAPRLKPPAWLFLSCLGTLTRILLLIFSVLPPAIHVMCKKMSLIHLSKQICWRYHYVLGAAGFNSGSRPHRDNDVCFVCSVHPPFNNPQAPFNRVLLSVLTTSSPQPFRSSLNPFLWITDRVLFPPPPLHSTEVAGEELLLV